jgi:endonuclease I
MKFRVLLFLVLPLFGVAQIPAYYSGINFSQTGNNLKNQLTTLITTTHTTFLPYTASGTTDTWDALTLTDINPDNPNTVLLIYGWDDTDTDITNDYTRDKTATCHTSSCYGLWQREHVFPRSLGTPNLGFEFAGSDAHNLRAVDADRNSSRSNRMFANAPSSAASYVITPSGSWYPGDAWRGDVARMIMYMYVRYPTQCAPTDVGDSAITYAPFGDMPDVFLDWNAQDPVSPYEINRNNVLQNIQGNRNPFIDNPYLATIIWSGPQATDTWGILSNPQQTLNQVVLYPTVTEGIVHLTNPDSQTYQYQLYNALGQLLKESTTTDAIALSNQAKGLYFIKVQVANQNKTFKVILK